MMLIAAITALALALPLALVFMSLRQQPPTTLRPPLDTAGLREALESVAEKNFGSNAAPALGTEVRMTVSDPAKSAKLIAQVAADMHGSALENPADDRSIRMAVSVPEGQAEEASRRIGLITGNSPTVPTEAGGLLMLLLVPAAEP